MSRCLAEDISDYSWELVNSLLLVVSILFVLPVHQLAWIADDLFNLVRTLCEVMVLVCCYFLIREPYLSIFEYIVSLLLFLI